MTDWSEVVYKVLMPLLTAFLGWIYSSYRNKQKKESDIIANFKETLAADRTFILECREDLKKSRDINKRLEAKLDRKNKSVRQANKCPYTAEGDGCPVLLQEEKNELCYDADCLKCEHHNPKCQ